MPGSLRKLIYRQSADSALDLTQQVFYTFLTLWSNGILAWLGNLSDCLSVDVQCFWLSAHLNDSHKAFPFPTLPYSAGENQRRLSHSLVPKGEKKTIPVSDLVCCTKRFNLF